MPAHARSHRHSANRTDASIEGQALTCQHQHKHMGVSPVQPSATTATRRAAVSATNGIRDRPGANRCPFNPAPATRGSRHMGGSADSRPTPARSTTVPTRARRAADRGHVHLPGRTRHTAAQPHRNRRANIGRQPSPTPPRGGPARLTSSTAPVDAEQRAILFDVLARIGNRQDTLGHTTSPVAERSTTVVSTFPSGEQSPRSSQSQRSSSRRHRQRRPRPSQAERGAP